MSRSKRKHVDVIYSNDESRDKYNKIRSRKRARKQRKKELNLALTQNKENEVYSLKNYHYDLFGVIEKGLMLNKKELKREIARDIHEGYIDVKHKRSVLNFRMRK